MHSLALHLHLHTAPVFAVDSKICNTIRYIRQVSAEVTRGPSIRKPCSELVCSQLESYINDTMTNKLDLVDADAEILQSFGEINKQVPRVLKPSTLLGENFFDTLSDVLDFVDEKNTNPLIKLVSTALRDREGVENVLSDMTTTVTNKPLLADPMNTIIAACAQVSLCTSSSEDRPLITSELLTQVVKALGALAIVQSNIGEVFTPLIESSLKSDTVALGTEIVNASGSGKYDKTILNAAQRVMGEADIIWPFSGGLEDLKHGLANELRTLSATSDREEFESALNAIRQATQYTPEMLETLTHSCEPLDLSQENETNQTMFVLITLWNLLAQLRFSVSREM